MQLATNQPLHPITRFHEQILADDRDELSTVSRRQVTCTIAGVDNRGFQPYSNPYLSPGHPTTLQHPVINS
jgi:hypothetical protein